MTTPRQRSKPFNLDPQYGYAQALRVGDRVLVSGTPPTSDDGACEQNAEAQTKQSLANIDQALKQVGSAVTDVVYVYLWQRHCLDMDGVMDGNRSIFHTIRPGNTQVLASAFLNEDWRIFMEAEGAVGTPRERISVNTYPSYLAAEAKIGWSRAYRLGDRLLISCCAPIWPDGPDSFHNPDPQAQTERCFEVIRGAIEAGGGTLADIVSTHLWMRHPADAEATAAGQRKVLGDIRPVTTQVALQGHLRPHWRVEVEAEADLSPERHNFAGDADLHTGPDTGASQTVRIGNRVLVSSTRPVYADGHIEHDPGVQVRRCWEIITANLKEAGAAPSDTVRMRIYIRHAMDGPVIGKFLEETFGDEKPAVTILPIHSFIQPEWRVEIEAEAVI